MRSSVEDLKRALLAEREATFFRLRGGYPIPLAGAIWWAALGAAGFVLPYRPQWILLAFATSGLIFPLAVLLAKVLGNGFMKDRTAISDLMFPAIGSMAIFWPIAFSAFRSDPQLVPLILAVGMSTAWPVMGWIYARTALFSAHAVVRAVACFVIWNWFPGGRFTILPLAVSAVYLITVAALLLTSSAGSEGRLHDGKVSGVAV